MPAVRSVTRAVDLDDYPTYLLPRLGRYVQPSKDASGATDAANINAALVAAPAHGGQRGLVWLSGDYYINTPLVLPSYRTLVLDAASIKLVDGAGCNFFLNSNQNATGNQGITVEFRGGSILYTNVAGNNTFPSGNYYQICPLLMVNVKDFLMKGWWSQASRYSPLLFQGCQDVRVFDTRIDQDNTTANQGGFEIGGCMRVQIQGVSGTVFDDLLDCAAFGSTAGSVHYWHPYMLTLPAAQRSVGEVSMRDVDVSCATVLRCLNGGGSSISYITVDNVANRNTAGMTPVVAFGPTSYVDTPPTPASVISVSVRNFDGPCNQMVAFDSHVEQFHASDWRVTNNSSTALLGHVSVTAGLNPTLTRIKVDGVVVNATAADLMALDPSCVVNTFDIDGVTANNLKAVLHNGCPVTGLRVNNVSVQNLSDTPFKSAGLEQGVVDDVRWLSTSGAFNGTVWGTRTALKVGPLMPTVSSLDQIPRPISGSTINCDTTVDPTGGVAITTAAGGTVQDAEARAALNTLLGRTYPPGARAGRYLGNGTRWVKQTDLGAFEPGQVTSALLQFWYAADRLQLTDGAAVSSWGDLSGSGLALAQATGANQPVYKTGIVNGLPVVRFDGVNDLLQTAAFTKIPNSAVIFCVAVWRALPTTAWLFTSTTVTGQLPDVLYKIAGGMAVYVGGNITAAAPTVGAGYVYYFLARSPTAAFGVNSVTTTTTGPGTANYGLTGLTLGANWDATSPAQVDVAELIVYSPGASGIMSSQDLSAVAGYLGGKYGITIT
jgi:hypothetical protein